MPPALDDRALRSVIAGLPLTRAEDGVLETIERFVALRDEGRLDTSDIQEVTAPRI
jgi:hypothetical protein